MESASAFGSRRLAEFNRDSGLVPMPRLTDSWRMAAHIDDALE
jgi:hypothetical protein